MMVAAITRKQIARVWATARDLGMDHDMLYTLVPGGSISHLDRSQAARLIDALTELEARQGHGPDRRPRKRSHSWRATEAQRAMIGALFHDLGWDSNPHRVQGFLRKYAHVDTVDDISHRKRASAVIEALKAIREREEAHASVAAEAPLLALHKEGQRGGLEE